LRLIKVGGSVRNHLSATISCALLATAVQNTAVWTAKIRPSEALPHRLRNFLNNGRPSSEDRPLCPAPPPGEV